jgi:hypothetical protein
VSACDLPGLLHASPLQTGFSWVPNTESRVTRNE